MYQKTYKGKVKDLLEELKKSDIRGEWVVIVKEIELKEGQSITYDDLMALDIPPKKKAKLLSKLTGKSIKNIYSTLL